MFFHILPLYYYCLPLLLHIDTAVGYLAYHVIYHIRLFIIILSYDYCTVSDLADDISDIIDTSLCQYR